MKKKILQINAIIFFIIFAIVVISMNIDINKIATNTILNSDMLIELNNNEYQYDINSNKIGTISNFNTSNKGLDSEPDYSRSTLEFNKNEDFDILISNLFEASELSKLKNKYCYNQDSSKCNIHIAQPRIIKTKSGKYVLTFYTTTDKIYLKYNDDYFDLLNNGLDVYYTISDDLKHWNTPKLLFECNYKEGVGINNTLSNNVAYGYVFPFLLELSDGKILILSAKWGIGKFGYKTAEAFNINGIYIKYGTIKDNNIEWTQKEEQIYKGLIYDPTAIETSDNELQVYFTSLAPVVYSQADQVQAGEYYAVQTSLHNSSGVAMISMFKDKTTGKYISTYTMPTNDLLPYKKTNKNPYVAYRIIQSYVATKTEPNIPYNLAIKPASNNKYVYGIKENGKVIQMGDGMASPLILNNKTMVMPLETTYIREENNYITSDLGISLAYSKPTSLNINGQNKNKYWIDLSNDFLNNAKSKNYYNEKEVYSNTGLGVSEVGPINRSKPVNNGSGPDIVQFPSGETLLSYHMWPSFQIKIGDNNAKFDNEEIIGNEIEEVRCYVNGTYKQGDKYNQYLHKKLSRNTYCAAINIADFGITNKGGFDFGGLYVDNSHRVLATMTYIDSKGSHLRISQYYLNHSIDSYSDGLSQKNDDAIFIGSDTSAQETVRSFHDNDYLYFVVDRLDTSISSADSNGLRIHSDALMYNGKKYNYLWISFNNQKITRTNVGFEGNLEKIENLVSAKYIYSDNGYKVIVKIPKMDKNKNFYFIDNNTKKVEVFAAITKGDKYDILEGAKESDIRTWMNVYLKEPKQKVKIPNSPTDKIYTGNVQNHGIIVPENTTIITSSTIQAKDVGEYEVVLKLNDTNKYVWEDGTSENKKIKWLIKQATPQITLTAKISDYSGNAILANTANVNPIGGKVSYVYYIDSNCSTKTTLENAGVKSVGGAPINAGTYYVKATAMSSLNTKQVSSGCIKHVINKKVLPIPVKIGDRLYSGSVQNSGIICPKGSIAGGEVSGVDAKTYTQTCTLSSNKNYIWSDGTTNVIKIDWKILSKEGTYKVTFNDGNNELYSGYVSSGKTISRPSINPEKVNYRFDNWYEDASFTKLFNFNTPIKSDIAIYAKFIEQRKITLDINGGIDNGFTNYLYDKGVILNRYDIEKQLNEFIIPPDNKKVDYITINGTKWEKNTYVLNDNITIKIIWKDKGITYEILTGNNKSYIIDSNSNFIIKSSGDLEKLINITMDGIIIEESNYDLTSGSTILTLKPSYLNQLPIGNHEIEFVYSDGSANAKITIVESDKHDNSYKDIVKNNNFNYIILLLSVLLLVGIIIYVKRKNHTN